MSAAGLAGTHIRVDAHLQMRCLSPDDVEPLFRLIEANRAHLREWLTWVDGHTSTQVTAEFIARVGRNYLDRTGLDMALTFDGELVGVTGFVRLDEANRCGEVGYWLAEPWGGRGLMTSACRALLAHGFAHLDLHRIEIRAAAENRRSRAIAERVGCEFEGLRRDAQLLNGRFVDMAVYSLLGGEQGA